jgi:hypothetical protein
MAERVERPLITLPWSEKYYADAEKAQAVEDEDRQLRVEMLKQKLYPADTAQKAAEELMQTTDSARRAALMQTLYETTGTATAPGTSLNVPAGTPDEAVDMYVDRQVEKVKFYRQKAMAEQDPEKRRLMIGIADAGEKSLIAKGKELTQADFAFEANVREASRMADDMENAIKKYGNYETVNPEGSAALGQLPYLFAVALAKVIDPGSVAREGEVEAAKKFAIPMGTSPIEIGINNRFTGPTTATTLAAIQGMRVRLKRRVEDYKSIAGRTVELPPSGLEDASQGQQIGQQPGQQAGQQAMPQQSAQPAISPSGFGGYDPRARKVIQNR